MAPVIHIQPVEAWGYFVKNKSRLAEELVEIATNETTNTSVYMTEEDDQPYLYVYRNDRRIFQSACTTIYETERNLRVVYAQYINELQVVVNNNDNKKDEDEKADDPPVDNDIPPVDDDDDDVPPLSDIDAMSEEEFQSYVSDREDAILSAVTDLISVLTEDSTGTLEFDSADIITLDVIVDHIVEYLAIKGGFRIRRPMTVVEDESGLSVRTEYPYEEFEFSESELHQ